MKKESQMHIRRPEEKQVKRVVKISVRGGVAYVDECPPDVEVKITDYDKQ